MNSRFSPVLVAVLVMGIFSVSQSWAWINEGQPLCTASGDQSAVQLVPDGFGGVIAVWLDDRDDSSDVYAQRFDKHGAPVWGPAEVAVCTAPGNQSGLIAVSDGNRGAYIAWLDYRAEVDIYAQHLLFDGTLTWPIDGALVCGANYLQNRAKMISDQHGGAVIVWWDRRDMIGQIYGQRIDASGVSNWGVDGLAICTAADDQRYPDLALLWNASYAETRVTVVWEDERTVPSNGVDVYAQRLTLDGVEQWGVNGLPVATTAYDEKNPHVVGGRSSTSYIIWTDTRAGTDLSDALLYMQRVDRYGSSYGWNMSFGGFAPHLVSDGVGGFAASYSHVMAAPEATTNWVMRFETDGTPEWTLPAPLNHVTGWSNSYGDTRLVADHAGRLTACYYGYDSGNKIIHARQVTADGDPTAWGPSEVVVSDTNSDHWDPQIVTVDTDHLVVAWTDERTAGTTGQDIYAQRLSRADGAWGYAPPIILEVSDVPDDQGGYVTVRFTASDRDSPDQSGAQITGYNLWRQVVPSAAKTVAPERILELMTDPNAAENLLLDANTAASLGMPKSDWVSLGFHAAIQEDEYVYLAATAQDSSGAGTALHFFFLTAHTAEPSVYFSSAVQSGYSVDNLVPGVPQGFAVAYGSDNELSWWPSTDNDFQYFKIYRGTTPDFGIDSANPWRVTVDTSYQDNSGTFGHFYKLAVVDFAGNESPAVSPESVTSVTETRVLRTELRACAPNPFNPATLIRFSLAHAGEARLEVFSVDGRLVRVLHAGPLAKGAHGFHWNGCDARNRALPSGTYFYRLTAGDYEKTRRMALLK